MHVRLVICVVAVAMVFGGRAVLLGKETKATKGPPPASKSKLKLLEIEENIVKHTNEQRRRYGLGDLKVDFKLVKSAREHAQWMTRNRSLQHTRAAVAENIAMGYPHSQAVVNGWMNSSGHRANILNGGYTRIGVAAYVTDGGTIYWCQQFLR